MTEEEKEIFYRKLASWLDEWELEQQLIFEEPVLNPEEKNHNIPFENPSYSDVKAGDILLLSNELTSGSDSLLKPLFIGVLRLWEVDEKDEYFLWAPFSLFGHPATDRELLTRNEDNRLSVLSIWNTHTSKKELLVKSWHIGEMEEQDRKDALSVFWHSLGMKTLSEELEHKVGPKLNHPKDPRHQYLENELKRTEIIRLLSIAGSSGESFSVIEDGNSSQSTMESLGQNFSAAEKKGKIIDLFAWMEEESKEKAKLVAGDQKRKSRYLKFRCEELPITLIFRSVPRFEQMIFELEIDDEELRNKMDEFLIIIQGEQNRELGFENGQCIQDFSLDHLSFSLKSPDGTVLNLTKLES